MPIAFLHFLRQHVSVQFHATQPESSFSFFSMLDSLLFGTWVLYALMFITFCVSAIALHKHHNATLGWITFFLCVVLGYNVWRLHLDLGLLALHLAVYVIIGAVWSVVKWWLYIKHTINNFDHEYLAKDSYARIAAKNSITVSRNKATITNWIIYWPVSVFLSFTHSFFEHLYDALSSVYTKIAAPAHAALDQIEEAATKPKSTGRI